MTGEARTCPSCGATGDGNFCPHCGSRLPAAAPSPSGPAGLTCPACGRVSEAGALYCAECGTPVAARASKPMRDRLPWILSGLALVAFAVALSLLIRESTGERAEGMPPTGAVIPSPGADGADVPPGSGDEAGGGPGAVDLSSMSRREAADRLFDRAMRTVASGDTADARFFARMGRQAYEAVSPGQLDADARFHVGMLALLARDRVAATAAADTILSEAPDHLLGWILRARIAAAEDDTGALREARDGFRTAYPTEREAGRPGYAQHAGLIDEQARTLGIGP